MVSPSLGLARRAPSPPVAVGGLDGTNLGIGLSLVRATHEDDLVMRDLIIRNVAALTAFGSCLDLLLAQVHWVAEAQEYPAGATKPCDGGAAFMFRLAQDRDLVEHSLLCRQIGMSLLRHPHPETIALTPVPVFDLVRLCIAVGRQIEARHGYRFEDQLTAFTRALSEAVARR